MRIKENPLYKKNRGKRVFSPTYCNNIEEKQGKRSNYRFMSGKNAPKIMKIGKNNTIKINKEIRSFLLLNLQSRGFLNK